eukprot:SAG31_NODE_25683_length_456_cov_1.308123_1_plen_26_part_10
MVLAGLWRPPAPKALCADPATFRQLT